MVDLRSEIFRLRSEGLSLQGIADQLGTNKSRVQRELQKAARAGGAGGVQGGVVGGGDEPRAYDPVLSTDPDLVERRRALERDRVELQRTELQARRLEAETRLAMLQNKGGGSDSQLAALIVTSLDRIREDIRGSLTRSGGAQPASLTSQLDEYKRLGEIIKAFAPTQAPSSAVDLEWRVMMEKVNREDQRLSRQWEADAEERRERLASQRTRDEAVANAIQNAAPLLTAALEQWLGEKKAPEVQRPALPPATGNTPELHVVNEIQGPCPRCGQGLTMVPETDDQCPACGAPLQAVEGEIRERALPGEVGRVPTYAS